MILPPTPALYRKWKMLAEKYRLERNYSKARIYEEKINQSPLKEVEMSDGRITFMTELVE